MKGQFKHTSGILYEAEKAELAFEMMKRLDIEYFCLQGSGGCGPAENLLQTEEQQKRLNVIIEEKMNKYNSKLLWGLEIISVWNRQSWGRALLRH